MLANVSWILLCNWYYWAKFLPLWLLSACASVPLCMHRYLVTSVLSLGATLLDNCNIKPEARKEKQRKYWKLFQCFFALMFYEHQGIFFHSQKKFKFKFKFFFYFFFNNHVILFYSSIIFQQMIRYICAQTKCVLFIISFSWWFDMFMVLRKLDH